MRPRRRSLPASLLPLLVVLASAECGGSSVGGASLVGLQGNATSCDQSTIAAKPAVFSPNPPACAANFADALFDITSIMTTVVYDTAACSTRFGGGAPLTEGDPRVDFVGNVRQCAADVIADIALAATVVGELLTAAFNCFNDREGCGQSIAFVVSYTLWGAQALVYAADLCAPPLANFPYSTQYTHDPPVVGFECWQLVWASLRRLFKAAVYLDTASDLCPKMDLAEYYGGAKPMVGLAPIVIMDRRRGEIITYRDAANLARAGSDGGNPEVPAAGGNQV